MELADHSTKPSILSSLQEELQTERAKLAAANKEVTANNSKIHSANNVKFGFPDV